MARCQQLLGPFQCVKVEGVVCEFRDADGWEIVGWDGGRSVYVVRLGPRRYQARRPDGRRWPHRHDMASAVQASREGDADVQE